MTELVLPVVAFGSGKGKYHLGLHGKKSGSTACGMKYGMPLKQALGGEKPISEIDAKDICQRCLGPLKVIS